MLSGRSMPPLVHPAHAVHAATQQKPAASGEFFLSLLPHAEKIRLRNATTLDGGVKPWQVMTRLLTPGGISPQLTLTVGILIMAMVAMASLTASPEIRLHVLYLFPLAAIALHCEHPGTVAFGLCVPIATLIWNVFEQGVHDNALTTDILITAASFALTVALARAFRVNYLATINLATTDWLTGLHNRRSFQIATDNEISRQQRYGGVFSLAMIDLDGFKLLIDSKGHQAGDTALKLVADSLKTHTRRTDVVARLGGDEFVILMPNTGSAACLRLTRQLVVVIAHHMARAGFGVTASIGSATFTEAPESATTALQRADAAMYEAKARGKGCAVDSGRQ